MEAQWRRQDFDRLNPDDLHCRGSSCPHAMEPLVDTVIRHQAMEEVDHKPGARMAYSLASSNCFDRSRFLHQIVVARPASALGALLVAASSRLRLPVDRRRSCDCPAGEERTRCFCSDLSARGNTTAEVSSWRAPDSTARTCSPDKHSAAVVLAPDEADSLSVSGQFAPRQFPQHGSAEECRGIPGATTDEEDDGSRPRRSLQAGGTHTM